MSKKSDIEWTNNNYIYGVHKEFKLRSKLAIFDLDDTIIKPKSGKKFAEDENDWCFITNAKDTILELSSNHSIIIITNQKGIKNNKPPIKQWQNKIENIQKELDVPLMIYASIDNDIYRKPHPTFYNMIESDNEYNIKEVFYCGDACGRANDHSDTDYKFALNCRIIFYTPEELFLGKEQEKFIKYPLDFKKINFDNNNNPKINYENNKTLIIMCGFPGSGKTTYVKNNLKGFIHINQDTLGTKDKCIKACKENMKKNKNIVIDNTNPSSDIRKLYLDLADEYEYKKICIKMETSREIAKHNMYYRFYKANKIKSESDDELDEKSKEKNKKVKHIPEIAYNKYAKDFKEPSKKEFDEIYKIKQNYSDNDDYLKYFFNIYMDSLMLYGIPYLFFHTSIYSSRHFSANLFEYSIIVPSFSNFFK